MLFKVRSTMIRAAACATVLMIGAHQALAIETTAREAIMVDTTTGAILLEKASDRSMPPASMSKLMTTYLLFERIRDGGLSLDDEFIVSENAWRKGGAKSGSSTMFLKPGSRVRVEDLIRGIIVQSGNDACIVVAESLAGSEDAFATQMTAKARDLGMETSVFKNATGWPHPEHRMTARDLAILAERIVSDFPDLYRYYQETEFTYSGIRQYNRNPLLTRMPGADGLKTGHTSEAGYGLTATAKRGDRRLVLVVNGLASKKVRRSEPQRLLEWGFREFDNYALFKAGEEIDTADVWLGEAARVPLLITQDVHLTLPRTARNKMKVSVRYQHPIPAPITEGTELGELEIVIPDRETIVLPLVAGATVPQLGMVGRLGAAFKYLLWGASGGA